MYQEATLTPMVGAVTLSLILLAVAETAAPDRHAMNVDPTAPPQRPAPNKSWTADNGNGTFSNPLFFDEFSDPDLIRVGDDYYMTGTTMHTFPGLPVLHSRDLVNWKLLSYACKDLNYGPAFRLEEGMSIYGQGIWAPSFRYYNGTYYIFSNVNGRATQVFTAKNPKGPWQHREMKRGFHDLSVLFDDDGKVYICWGYRDIRIAQLNENLDDIVPGTEQAPFGKDALIGEGAHFYKINGKYYILSAWYAGRMRMPCARADNPYGPYELNPEISADEAFGLTSTYRLRAGGPPDKIAVSDLNPNGGPEGIAMHQGGIVQTQSGEWWGFSMMDANSVGRLTCLSPVTWKDGWPLFGLPGNLGRTPRTWFKPNTGFKDPVQAPYVRSDDFNGDALVNVWQWNHVPNPDQWSLTERPGHLRIKTAPAESLWTARNTLTQRCIGPESTATVDLDATGLRTGDTAGLGLINYPHAWLGVRRTDTGLELACYDQLTGATQTIPLTKETVQLRVHTDFMRDKARFSYSLDGKTFTEIGAEVTLVFQLKTFQGVRFGLFAYGSGGGHADFDQFSVHEPRPQGTFTPIPVGQRIVLRSMSDQSVLSPDQDRVRATQTKQEQANHRFNVVDLGNGVIALESANGKRVTVHADGSTSLQPAATDQSQQFLWTEMPRSDIMLLSLVTHRYLAINNNLEVSATAPGAQYNRKNGASFSFTVAKD